MASCLYLHHCNNEKSISFLEAYYYLNIKVNHSLLENLDFCPTKILTIVQSLNLSLIQFPHLCHKDNKSIITKLLPLCINVRIKWLKKNMFCKQINKCL